MIRSERDVYKRQIQHIGLSVGIELGEFVRRDGKRGRRSRKGGRKCDNEDVAPLFERFLYLRTGLLGRYLKRMAVAPRTQAGVKLL